MGGTLPACAHQSHAMHPFDGDHTIRSAQDGPITPAQRIHPGHAIQPRLASHGRTITTKAARFNFKAQQAQPVAQAPIANKVAAFGQIWCAQAHATVQTLPALRPAPQTCGVQSTNDDTAVRYQHALRLTQGGVRVMAKFQRMGQYQQVERSDWKRQRSKIGQQIQAMYLCCVYRVCCPTVGHAVCLQTGNLWQAQLQCMVAKNVCHDFVKLCLFPVP